MFPVVWRCTYRTVTTFWRLLLCLKKEAKEGRNVGKNKSIPTHELGLVRHGLLYEAFMETSCGDYCYIFLKEEREGEERKREEEVRRDRGKERRGEGKREGA